MPIAVAADDPCAAVDELHNLLNEKQPIFPALVPAGRYARSYAIINATLDAAGDANAVIVF